MQGSKSPENVRCRAVEHAHVEDQRRRRELSYVCSISLRHFLTYRRSIARLDMSTPSCLLRAHAMGCVVACPIAAEAPQGSYHAAHLCTSISVSGHTLTEGTYPLPPRRPAAEEPRAQWGCLAGRLCIIGMRPTGFRVAVRPVHRQHSVIDLV